MDVESIRKIEKTRSERIPRVGMYLILTTTYLDKRRLVASDWAGLNYASLRRT